MATGIAIIEVAGTYAAAQHQPDRRPFDFLAAGLIAAGALALVERRRHPVAVLATAFAATLTYLLANYAWGPIWLSLIVAFFTALTSGHRLVGWVAIGVGYPMFLWLDSILGRGSAPSAPVVVGNIAWLLVLVASAEAVRVRRAYAAEAHRRMEEAARAREQEQRRRRSEERLRIARELHDVLAHNISLMNVQASTALHLLDSHPEQARPALTAVKEASSDALKELRSVLDALRQTDEGVPRTPVPSLARLGDLAARAEAGGLTVETVVEGKARSLPASVELAAYRICQEAMTNVIRHAGPASARIRLSYGEDELDLQIDDDGRGAAADTSNGGSGLAGMRDRALALGGSFSAGPRPGGGFRVSASLPLERLP